jgi:hypothetical protein
VCRFAARSAATVRAERCFERIDIGSGDLCNAENTSAAVIPGVILAQTFHLPKATFPLLCWIAAQAVVFAVCLLLSARTFPHYSLIDHDISFLGDPQLNPVGWWFWSAGMILDGLMLWPIATRLSGAIRALVAGQSLARRRLAAAGTFAARCCSIGLVGLGLIPQVPGIGPAHEVAGALAMGGMYVALWLFAAILITSPPISTLKTLLLILAVGWGPAGYLLTQGWRFFVYDEGGHDVRVTPQLPLLQFSLWEWLLMICLLIAQVVVVCFLPAAPAPVDPADRMENAGGGAIE